MELVHATAVDIKGTGILIRGPSGSGKSDLALRLIDDTDARLIADDYVALSQEGGALYAAAPGAIRGKIEIRGIGIIAVPYRVTSRVGLIVSLVPPEDMERLPPVRHEMLLGVEVRCYALHAFEASAPAKVNWMVSQMCRGGL